MIKNYMEQVVDEILSDVLKKYTDACKCETCINDIKAIALNNLKPRYFSSEVGSIYLKMDEFQVQKYTDVTSEVIKAIKKVTESSKHN